jgi:hypothetical protein
MRLTTKKEIVLRFLAAWKFESPPDGPEISEYTGNLREWATPILVSLEKQGLVERLGKSDVNAWCWRIKPAGRLALSSGRDQE